MTFASACGKANLTVTSSPTILQNLVTPSIPKTLFFWVRLHTFKCHLNFEMDATINAKGATMSAKNA
jgi:hypothetical protein